MLGVLGAAWACKASREVVSRVMAMRGVARRWFRCLFI
jgi:hypothetical protein